VLDEVYILFHFNILLKHNGMSSTKKVTVQYDISAVNASKTVYPILHPALLRTVQYYVQLQYVWDRLLQEMLIRKQARDPGLDGRLMLKRILGKGWARDVCSAKVNNTVCSAKVNNSVFCDG